MKKLLILVLVFGAWAGWNLYWGGVKRFDLKTSTQQWVVEQTRSGDTLNADQIRQLADLASGKKMPIVGQVQYEWQRLALKNNPSATFLVQRLEFRHKQMSWCPFKQEEGTTVAEIVINTAKPNTPEWVATTPSPAQMRTRQTNVTEGPTNEVFNP
jgi:hypothetical protein